MVMVASIIRRGITARVGVCTSGGESCLRLCTISSQCARRGLHLHRPSPSQLLVDARHNVKHHSYYFSQSARLLSSGSKPHSSEQGKTDSASEDISKADNDCTAEEAKEDTTSPDTEQLTDQEDEQVVDEKHQPLQLHFPWRHDPHLTERLQNKDDLSGMPNNWRARFVRRLVACRELNMPVLDAAPLPFGFTHPWEDDLSNNFKVAWALALEELLRSIFPGSQVSNDIDCVSIDTSIRNEDGSGSEKNNTSNLKDNEFLHGMMDKDLISQYQNMDVDNLHLRLSMRPVECRLQHIFAIPMLSRLIVQKNPHLKGSYQQIENAFLDGTGFDGIKKMTHNLAKKIGEEDAFTRTVIADCVITCHEFFQVKDLGSGEIIQGMQDGSEEEEVYHNVRFEVVTERDHSEGRRNKRVVGSWKIIDVDDMLDGNVFH